MADLFNVAAHSIVPNHGGAFVDGVKQGQGVRKSLLEDYLLRKQDKQSTQSQLLGQQYATSKGEEKQLLGEQLQGVDPERYNTILGNEQKSQEISDNKNKAEVDFFAKAAMQLENTPEEQRPQVYDQLQGMAVQRGFMTIDEYEPYSPEVMNEMQVFKSQGQDTKDQTMTKYQEESLKREDQRIAISTKKIGEEKMGEAEKKIQRILDTQNVSRAEAVAIVDGVKKVTTDPVTGRTSLVDLISGESKPFEEIQGDRVESEISLNKDGLYNKADAGTGLESAIQAGIGKVQGLIGQEINPESEEAIEARQSFNLATQSLTRALAVNPRFAEGELKRIQGAIDIKPQFYTSGDELKIKLRNVDDYLKQEAELALELYNDDMLPMKQRQQELGTYARLQKFRKALSIPQEDKKSGERIEKVLNGKTYIKRGGKWYEK